MSKEFFKNLPDTSTPLNASRLNGLLNGDEAMGTIMVEGIKSKNLFDIHFPYNITKFNVINDGMLNDRILMNSAGDWASYTLNNVPIIANKELTFSCDVYNTGDVTTAITIFDANENELIYQTLERPNEKYSICFTSSTDTIRIVFHPNFTSNYETNYVEFINPQIELGSTATEYVPYNNFDNKQIYSYHEKVIGRWIAGEPIYRKVIEGVTSSEEVTSAFIGNNIIIRNFHGFIYYSSAEEYVPLNYSNPNGSISSFTHGIENCYLNIEVKNIAFRNCEFFAVVEYIKKTW